MADPSALSTGSSPPRPVATGSQQYAPDVYPVQDREIFVLIEGRVLEQLCFGRHQLLLEFDGDVSITVEGAIGLATPDAEEAVVEDAGDIASALVRLISESVVAVQVSDSRSLLLKFAGGQVLRLIDDSEQFESFQVRRGDRLIVV